MIKKAKIRAATILSFLELYTLQINQQDTRQIPWYQLCVHKPCLSYQQSIIPGKEQCQLGLGEIEIFWKSNLVMNSTISVLNSMLKWFCFLDFLTAPLVLHRSYNWKVGQNTRMVTFPKFKLVKWSRIFVLGTGSAIFRMTKIAKRANFKKIGDHVFSSSNLNQIHKTQLGSFTEPYAKSTQSSDLRKALL